MRLLTLLPLVVLALLLPTFTRAQEQHRAGLVVRHGDGRVATACVTFSEPSLSGVEVLERSGFSMTTQGGGIGAAVCKLDGEGCDYPTEGCFCKRDGTQSVYWAYSQLRDGVWAYSPLGASNTTVQDGDVEGWAWGNGDSRVGAVPPVLPLDQICTVTQPQPTAMALAPATRPVPPTVRPTRVPLTATSAPAAATPMPPTMPVATAVALAPTNMPMVAPTPIPAPPLIVAVAPSTVPTAHPLPTMETSAQTAAPASGTTNYLAFGALALLLVGGIIIAARRR